MKLLALALLLLATVSCESDRDKAMSSRGGKYEDRWLVLRDAHGRCIQLDLQVETYGSEHVQSGYMNARYLPEAECFVPSEGKP